MIITIIALGFLVFIHESAHFLAAKASGVPIEEFSVGFGKILFQKDLNGTKYSFRICMIGGYVRLSDTFRDRSPIIRMNVALAGPAANLLFAFLSFSLISFAGLPELTSKFGTVFPGHPAAVAGFLPGDRVIAVEGRPVSKWMEMTSLVNQGKDRSLHITVQRGQGNLDVVVRPELLEGRGVIGVKASGENVTKRFGGLASTPNIYDTRNGTYCMTARHPHQNTRGLSFHLPPNIMVTRQLLPNGLAYSEMST